MRGRSRIRYPKYYTVKQWKKFRHFVKNKDGNYVRDQKGNHITMQEIICNTYDVILTDHRTRKEKLIDFARKFTLENFNKGIDSFSKGVDDLSKMMEEFSKEMGKIDSGGKKDYSVLTGKNTKRDYSFLTGKKTRKKSKKKKSRKKTERDYSALTGKGNYSALTGKRDYSFLIGKK